MTNKIAQITSSISEDFDIFEAKLKKIIKNSDNFLKDNLYDFVFNDAKFLRPRLIFLFSKILNIKNENTTKIALATELLHNASLIHDDIIDGAIIRRKLVALNIKFNPRIAVLMGDILLSIALNILSETSADTIKIFSKKIYKTIQGELNQNENSKKITSIETYLKKTFDKTANLFFAGLESLFLLGDFDTDLKSKLKNYLTNFCLAFQIQNDLKDIDSDFNNGNYTLPLIYYFEENKNYEKQNLEKYILKTKNTIDNYKQKSIESLKGIENEYTKALLELVKIL